VTYQTRHTLSNLSLIWAIGLTVTGGWVVHNQSIKNTTILREVSELRSTLISLDAGVIEVDTHGIIVRWSPGVTMLLGWTPSEAIGHNLSFLMQGTLKELHEKVFVDDEKTRAFVRERVTIDCKLLSKAGTPIIVSVLLHEAPDNPENYVVLLVPRRKVIRTPSAIKGEKHLTPQGETPKK